MSEETNAPEKPEPRKGNSKRLIKVAFVALFAAFTAAGAFIAVPVGPVPIVLQNLFALLSGLILGPVMGGTAVCLYLLAGILGVPVFAGGTAGIARFAGPTGGFLVGYLLSAVAAGAIAGQPRTGKKTPLPRIIAAVTVGFLIIYVPGVIWLEISQNLGWGRALLAGFVPFIGGDIFKGIVAVIIAPRLRRTAAGFLDGE